MSPGIVMACVGEEKRSSRAKGEECGHRQKSFRRRSQKKRSKGEQIKKIRCSVTRFEVSCFFLSQVTARNSSWYGMI